MIVLIGHSGSGKDTAIQAFQEMGFKTIVSYTTRPPRDHEVEGMAYHFISEEEFLKKVDSGFFAENVEYRGWHYGIAKEDCLNDRVVIVEPKGLSQLRDIFGDNIKVIFLQLSEGMRRERLHARGDDPEEIERRIRTDRELFSNFDYDFVFTNIYNSPEEFQEAIKKHFDFLKGVD